jgi:DNA-binding NtrC family response regulator
MNNSQSSSVFQTLIQNIMEAARSTDNLCIIGEVGTGKRQAAVSVHKAAGLDEGRFSVVNCMALSHQEFLSDLFGRVTDDGDLVRKGAVALAEGGTLYLHEVHELARESQAALVRFLETKSYRPVGSGMNLTANVRIIVSSSATLEALVETGKFRQDLQHFLTPLIIHMPRLNDRIEDIPTLFKSLVYQVSKGAAISFEEEALLRLKTHSYTGNLLELRNLALRCISSMKNACITLEDVEGAIRGTAYFDLADQRLINPSNDLAVQAGDERFKAIQSVSEPKMLGVDSLAEGSSSAQSASDSEFSDLNRHISMGELSGSDDDNDLELKPVSAAELSNSQETTPTKGAQPPSAGQLNLKDVERNYFLDLLDQFQGDKAKVAKTAGLNLRTLYRRLKALEIE